MQLLLSGVLLSGGALIDLDATVLFQAFTFLAVFLILWRLVFRPMTTLFEAREQAIDGAKAAAKKTETEAEAALQEFQGKLQEAKVAAAAERDRLRADGQRIERELLAKAREESGQTLSDATKKMTEEADVVRAQIKEGVPAMAGQIAEKLLGRKAT